MAVGDQNWPFSSSRMYRASPLVSLTGSLYQGVRRNCWEFSPHVYAPPLSEITVPKLGFDITFDHGAGVACPGATRIMYSRPSLVNPPRPLKKIRSGRVDSTTS